MNLRIPTTDPSILEALLLQASGSWRSLGRLGSQGVGRRLPLAAALLRALCLSPLQEVELGGPSLDALAQFNHRSASALALSRTLMALAQEYLLAGETSQARVCLRQALASSVNAVLSTGMPMPAHLADQLVNQADSLAATLACQLDLAMAIRGQHLPEQLVLVLVMHRSESATLAAMLGKAGLDDPHDLKPTNPGHHFDSGESRHKVELSEQLLQHLEHDSSSCGKLFEYGWDIHAEGVRSWRAGMLELLQTAYASGGRALLLEPRLSLLLPAFRPWLETNLINCAVFLPIRHPADVAESIKLAEGIPCSQTLLLWLRHVFQAERNCRSLQRFIFDYQMLLSETQTVWRSCAQLLEVEIGELPLPAKTSADKASRWIDPEFRQQMERTDLPSWVLDEQTEAWYNLALHVYALLLDSEIEEETRRASMDEFWLQWTTIAP